MKTGILKNFKVVLVTAMALFIGYNTCNAAFKICAPKIKVRTYGPRGFGNIRLPKEFKRNPIFIGCAGAYASQQQEKKRQNYNRSLNSASYYKNLQNIKITNPFLSLSNNKANKHSTKKRKARRNRKCR